MVLGLMRVKNEARWIERAVLSILPLCDRMLVFDDHSSDETAAICGTISRVKVLASPFEGLDEVRDKNWLLDQAIPLKPSWIIFSDGDEVLPSNQLSRLQQEMHNPRVSCLSLRIAYLWNNEYTIRMDGVYSDFHRESIFRPNGARFIANGRGAHFHCGNVPAGNRIEKRVVDVPLLHLGYMHREDRLRKWEFYNQHDPRNPSEGYDSRFPERRSYPHIVQGDIPEVPASAKLMHGGPLQLAPL